MIEVTELTKRYGQTTAVDHLTFTVEPGRVTGFLGPNGAGKSTTMRLIMGLARPDSGHAGVAGRPYRQLARPLHEVGALLEARAAHAGRTARHHLLWLAQMHGIQVARVDELTEPAGLSAVADRRVGAFSLCMTQRLGMAAVLLGDPGVLYTGHVAGYRQMSAAERATADPVFDGLVMGLFIGSIGFATFGLLAATGEYASGTISATLAAVPRRLPALWAKAIVVTAAVGAVATAAEFVAFLITQRMLAGASVQVALSDPGVPRAVAGAAAYVTGTALLALGLGMMIRHTVGAVAAAVVVFFVLPLVTLTQPESWGEVTKFLPNAAGMAMLHTVADPAALSPGAGLAVYAAWIAVALTAAAVLLRRDW